MLNNDPTDAVFARSSLKLSVDFFQLRITAQRIRQKEVKEKVLTYLQEREEEVKDYHEDVADGLKVDGLLKRLEAFLNQVKQATRELRQQQLGQSLTANKKRLQL